MGVNLDHLERGRLAGLDRDLGRLARDRGDVARSDLGTYFQDRRLKGGIWLFCCTCVALERGQVFKAYVGMCDAAERIYTERERERQSDKSDQRLSHRFLHESKEHTRQKVTMN